ncbi:hypothetical protein QCA50_017393 [Cerrena zonata]|uniref:Uncharacterized protein n=1 Tax=Cerrena zonata TaxID=2478898 RepID=A0AAW0FQS9_9APHY
MGPNTALVNTSPHAPRRGLLSPHLLYSSSNHWILCLGLASKNSSNGGCHNHKPDHHHLPDDPIADNVAMSLDDHRIPLRQSLMMMASPSTIGVPTPTGPSGKAPSDTLSSDEDERGRSSTEGQEERRAYAILSQEKSQGPTMLKLAPDSHRKRTRKEALSAAH